MHRIWNHATHNLSRYETIVDDFLRPRVATLQDTGTAPYVGVTGVADEPHAGEDQPQTT